jgi:hypothetical protein
VNNLLTQRPPSSVTVHGVEYPIETDFRTCLQVILAYEDSGLTAGEKHKVLLCNLYGETIPADVDEGILQGIHFLDGTLGDESDKAGEMDPRRYYSFSKDANLIFSAFRQTHDIDLETEDMHWWKFIALFMDLGSATTFSNLVSLRKRVKTGTATKEERRVANELGDMFELPDIDTRSIDDKIAESRFMQLLGKGA